MVIQDDQGERKIDLKATPIELSTGNKMITIKFDNDNGTRNEVFFETKEKVDISLLHQFRYWKCGAKDENIRCSQVRSGSFAWQGSYEISFDGMSFLVINPSSEMMGKVKSVILYEQF